MNKILGTREFSFGIVALLISPLSVYAYRLPLIQQLITLLLRPFANLMFVAATLVFVWGIVEYIAGASNETARTTGRQHILWGTVGLVIMVSVYFILSIISSFFYSN